MLASPGAVMPPAAAQNAALPTVTLAEVGAAAFTWPELVAIQQGFFTAAGLNVEVVYTNANAADAQQLIAGSVDIAEVSPVQLIEAVLGGAPIVAFLSHQTKVAYSLLGKKGLTSVAQLRGKTVMIGGPGDITRVFSDKILADAKLGSDDFTYVYAGATDQRFAALVNGGVDAAMLSPPTSLRAAGLGYPVLADVSKYFPNFLFGTYAVRPAWAQAHPAEVVAFAKGFVRAVRWLYDPANRSRAIALLSERTHTSLDDATQSYDLFVTAMHIFSPNGVLRDADFKPVLDAMVRTGQIPASPPPPSRFYDNRYVLEANKAL